MSSEINKQINNSTFLLIDNANFGSVVMEQIKYEFYDIYLNLNEYNTTFNLCDYPYMIERYIYLYLYLIYYFHEQGIPFYNMIFFRDCNHTSNWRKQIIPSYKEGKSRFADKMTYKYFERKDELNQKYEEDSKISIEEKWNLEDKIDDIKRLIKKNEKFIHELANIERYIHFYLNDTVCHLSNRTCCEADEQMFICAIYLLTKYPSCKVKIISNDTDMIQCISSQQSIIDMMNVCDKECKPTFNINYSNYPIVMNRIEVYKCIRNPIELFMFKSIRDIYKKQVIDQILLYKIICGKRNDNLPDPSSEQIKIDIFGKQYRDIYKPMNIKKDKILDILKINKPYSEEIKKNIICSSFMFLPKSVIDTVTENILSIDSNRNTKFEYYIDHCKQDEHLRKFVDSLKLTVITYLEEQICRFVTEALLYEACKLLGRYIMKKIKLNSHDLFTISYTIAEKYKKEINRCKPIWLQKHIDILMLKKEYNSNEYETKYEHIYKPLTSYIKSTFDGDINELEKYIVNLGNIWLMTLIFYNKETHLLTNQCI